MAQDRLTGDDQAATSALTREPVAPSKPAFPTTGSLPTVPHALAGEDGDIIAPVAQPDSEEILPTAAPVLTADDTAPAALDDPVHEPGCIRRAPGVARGFRRHPRGDGAVAAVVPSRGGHQRAAGLDRGRPARRRATGHRPVGRIHSRLRSGRRRRIRRGRPRHRRGRRCGPQARRRRRRGRDGNRGIGHGY
ncbi:hypothetical protein [Demequina litorisediminis]|uniref:hypothetical protein n=1 Tax=Demequina litorisediminis TaxID=1849022 RepID=UPI0024E1313D|nr:hypothetical protein [Demequina litorisediminis]